jgi:L-ascorbate metabolism protein UlaG (beta-lactamase superfamily)
MADAHAIHLPHAGPHDGTDLDDREGSVFFIGTATVLVRFAGLTILTDPNFLHRGEKVHLGYGLHATRRTEPALTLDELPPVDLVLLSHLHEDHFDRKVSERLDRRLPIVTTNAAAVALRRRGFVSTHALSTWQALEVTRGTTRLAITSMPGRHGPMALHYLLPPVMGSVLDFETPTRRFRMYVSGDTMIFQQLHEIPRRFPDIDLALLHLGGTRVLGVVVTMDGPMGVEAMRIVQPRRTIPIHYDDYDVFRSPLSDFQHAVEAAGLADRVTYLARGETHRFVPRTWSRPSRPSREGRPSVPTLY